MQWVLDNWIWILLGGGLVVMHLFGHGKHGKTAEAASSNPGDVKPVPQKSDKSGEPS